MAKVLIADDCRVHVQLMSGWLQQRQIEVVSTFDCMQAAMMAIRKQPNAIVLDINMPGGSGIDVLKRLKSSTKTKAIPVVVISGNATAQMREFVQRLGAAEFMEKPLEEQKFCSLITGLAMQAEVRQ